MITNIGQKIKEYKPESAVIAIGLTLTLIFYAIVYNALPRGHHLRVGLAKHWPHILMGTAGLLVGRAILGRVKKPVADGIAFLALPLLLLSLGLAVKGLRAKWPFAVTLIIGMVVGRLLALFHGKKAVEVINEAPPEIINGASEAIPLREISNYYIAKVLRMGGKIWFEHPKQGRVYLTIQNGITHIPRNEETKLHMMVPAEIVDALPESWKNCFHHKLQWQQKLKLAVDQTKNVELIIRVKGDEKIEWLKRFGAASNAVGWAPIGE